MQPKRLSKGRPSRKLVTLGRHTPVITDYGRINRYTTVLVTNSFVHPSGTLSLDSHVDHLTRVESRNNHRLTRTSLLLAGMQRCEVYGLLRYRISRVDARRWLSR